MATKVAINGFGRIGRLVARAILERNDHDLELVRTAQTASISRLNAPVSSPIATARVSIWQPAPSAF